MTCDCGDSKHEIAKDIRLRSGGVLHRFNNAGNVPYSAIYVDGFEVWSCERDHESRMVKDWNNMHADEDES